MKRHTNSLKTGVIAKNNQIYQVLIVGYPAHEFQTYVSRAQPKTRWI